VSFALCGFLREEFDGLGTKIWASFKNTTIEVLTQKGGGIFPPP
jgi:hypothetical protein